MLRAVSQTLAQILSGELKVYQTMTHGAKLVLIGATATKRSNCGDKSEESDEVET